MAPPLTDWSANKDLTDGLINYNDSSTDYNSSEVYYNSYNPNTETPEERVVSDWAGPSAAAVADWTENKALTDSLNIYDDPNLTYDSTEFYDTYDPSSENPIDAIATDWSAPL